MRSIRFLYNLAYPIGLVLLLPWLIRRMIRRGKYRHKFGQRFAIYSGRVRERLAVGGWTWVHAVSVGEVLIAMKLIHRLRERDPKRRFVLSTTTSTGFAMANEQRNEWLEPIYNPLDFFWFTRRALNLIRPSQLVLVEAEVWPNLVAQARVRGVPAYLVNARLSPRSEARFRMFRAFTAPVFNQLEKICVQEPEDVERWQSLGISPERIVRTGSIKFDDALSKQRAPRDFRPMLERIGVPASAPILLAGSTHAGEEAALARIFQSLRAEFPGLFFIAVPRHAERSPQIREELNALGLRVLSRSQIESRSEAETAMGNPQPSEARSPLKSSFHPERQSNIENPEVLLVDTTGELRDWYASATVVFVGKSLLSTGGQNPAEPLVAGVPVVVGPYMQNFAILMHGLLQAGGIAQAPGQIELAAAIGELLRDPDQRSAAVAAGRRVIASHRHATDRTCHVLGVPAIPESAPQPSAS